ncbi:unnamed protein product, partial [Symbiodinium sp. KB8]
VRHRRPGVCSAPDMDPGSPQSGVARLRHYRCRHAISDRGAVPFLPVDQLGPKPELHR